jgi:hypothetical protein
VTLQGTGTAIIDGGQQTAVTVRGAQNVKLADLEVRNGLSGILADAGAHLTLNNVDSHDNAAFGVALQNHSGASFVDVTTWHNGLNGLDLESTSAVTLSGQFTTEDNAVFGINVNAGSSLTLIKATVNAENNLLGIQIGTSASAFIADSASTITVQNNQTTGLTVVSGSHLVSFGGKIVAHGNGRNGVSVNSKAGLDLDAASLLESYQNGGDGVRLAESAVMTLFNTTAFSGVPGNTTLKSHDNDGHGLSVLLGSNLTLVNQVVLESRGNGLNGVLADNGSALTLLQSTITGNRNPDVQLGFGSRADITASIIGIITCDATVLIRGDTGTTCPTN